MRDVHAKAYWKANVRILITLLSIWFFVSFVCGILLADYLDHIRFAGFKLGFWIAQQGSIYVFVILIIVYLLWMDKLDARYQRDRAADTTNAKVAAGTRVPSAAESTQADDAIAVKESER
jgi:putative solute:sodium symporter small subunit